MNNYAVGVKTIEDSTGSQLLVEDVNWQQFESILAELGDRRAS